MIVPKPQTHVHNQNLKFCCSVRALAKKKMDLAMVYKENSCPLQRFLLAKLPPALYDTMISAGGDARTLYDDVATIQHTTISQFTPHL
jgi:hypothetical protein